MSPGPSRPGPGLPGFGALARTGSVRWRLRKPRRTRAGVRRPGGQGRCQGRRMSAARSRARVQLGVAGDDEPGPAVGGGRVAELRPGPAELLLEEPEHVPISKRRRNACPARSRAAADAAAAGLVVHSHSGSGSRSPGRRSTWSRTTVPSMTGSSPGWSFHCRWRASRWCIRPQAAAVAVPVAAGLGDGGDRRGRPGLLAVEPDSGPCRAGRPHAADCRAAGGEYITGSPRSRRRTSTGRSRSSQASRVRS